MVWLLLSILSMASASGGRQSGLFASSFSDVVREGVTLVSRFLNTEPPNFLFSSFHGSKEGVPTFDKVGKEGGGTPRNEFILAALRLMGVDSRKINDFAFDGIISLLHLMNEVLLKDGEKSRKGRGASRDLPSLQFILRQKGVSDLLKDMQNPKLIDQILKESKEKLKEENADCILLLICKTKPFVRGMQRSLRFFIRRGSISGEVLDTCRNVLFQGRRDARPRPGSLGREETCEEEEEEEARWDKEGLEGRMYFFFPPLREVTDEGDNCDRLFPNCVY